MAYEFAHTSIYMLMLEPNTPFQAKYTEGEKPLPTVDETALMYELVQSKLEQYEVSNFTRKGNQSARSKHNQMYWTGYQPWLAFGNGAASFVNRVRFSRPRSLVKYYEYV